jgi:hypothetical protein
LKPLQRSAVRVGMHIHIHARDLELDVGDVDPNQNPFIQALPLVMQVLRDAGLAPPAATSDVDPLGGTKPPTSH